MKKKDITSKFKFAKLKANMLDIRKPENCPNEIAMREYFSIEINLLVWANSSSIV